jgi:hypothetical protein
MSNTSFSESFQLGVHSEFQNYTGNWTGQCRVWFGPDQLADEAEMTGTIRIILNGRFLVHEYTASFQGKPLEGFMIMGYDLHTDRFQSAWIDTFHMNTGILFSQGGTGKKSRPDVVGSYSSGGESPEEWGWQTDMQLQENGELIITAYNISPQGESVKATETIYRRI